MANQAWQINAPSNLQLVDLGPSLPQPGPNQALIRVNAVSLNFRDRLVITHSSDYPVKAKEGLVPCSDAAGTVEQAGENSPWKKGDRVIVFFSTWLHGNDSRDWDMHASAGAATADGTLRRYLAWDDERLVRAPHHLSLVEAARCRLQGSQRRSLFSTFNSGWSNEHGW
jgi:NADPH:quinone reductase-like Zn-dependent oxidoreductase